MVATGGPVRAPPEPATSVGTVIEVVVATDADAVFDEVDAALSDESTQVVRVRSGADVAAVVAERDPDLVVLDLQIGNMGGVAVSLHLRNEIIDGRLPDVPVLMLLDRAADVFLARRSAAAGWLVKPLDAFALRRAVTAVLEGHAHTDAQRPAQPDLVGEVNPA